MKAFPIFKAGTILNDVGWKKDIKAELKYKYVKIFYPCRLDAMAINPAAVVYNDELKFTPGEVVVSINMGVFVTIKVKDMQEENYNKLDISKTTKRKVLVRHAHGLMKNIFKNLPNMEIDVDSSQILKHCGFGSSSSTITAVCSAINELFGHPVKNSLLIKYTASNHGEEITDDNENDLKSVQCIGGGATGGLTNAGIIIIAGESTTIAKMKYKGDVLIAIPNDFVEKDAKVLMELEEKNLWKFEKTGLEYKDIIAYHILHKALPDMASGKIKGLADIVFDYRFNMGSNNNCSFVCDRINDLNEELKPLYLDGHCDFLALSSVGPAFFTITTKKDDLQYCKKFFEEANMNVTQTKILNFTYKILWRK